MRIDRVDYLTQLNSRIDALEAALKNTQPQPPDGKDEPCPVEIPQGLRWPQPASDQPVTYSYNNNLSPADQTWLTRCWDQFVDWVQTNSRLRFLRVASSGNISIGIREIDGTGRVLGETRIQYRGDIIIHAAIHIDRADSRRISRAGTHLHEGCHAIGIQHGGGGLMAPTQNAIQTFGPWELAQLHARYLKGEV